MQNLIGVCLYHALRAIVHIADRFDLCIHITATSFDTTIEVCTLENTVIALAVHELSQE